MIVEYIRGDLHIVLEIVDENGEPTGLGDCKEVVMFERYFEAAFVGFGDILNEYRKRKESQNGMERQDEGMGRG